MTNTKTAPGGSCKAMCSTRAATSCMGGPPKPIARSKSKEWRGSFRSGSDSHRCNSRDHSERIFRKVWPLYTSHCVRSSTVVCLSLFDCNCRREGASILKAATKRSATVIQTNKPIVKCPLYQLCQLFHFSQATECLFRVCMQAGGHIVVPNFLYCQLC